jgi:hypothetical protein
MHNPGLAVRFVGLTAGDFGGHFDGRLDGHSYLKRSGSDEEKPPARDVDGFREVFAFIPGKIDGAEAQRDAQAVALEMSAFRRRHVSVCACSGEGARADVNLCHLRVAPAAGWSRGYEGVRMGYDIRLTAAGAAAVHPDSAK